MRAIVLSTDAQAKAGGAERFAQHVAGALRDDGWEAEVVDPGGEAPRPAHMVAVGRVLESLEAGRRAGRRRPDLVIGHGQLGFGTPRDVRRIHLLHGTMPGVVASMRDELTRRHALRMAAGGGAAEALSCWTADHVVAVSKFVADDARRRLRVRVDEVVPNGVDLSVFAPRDRAEARARLGLASDARLALFVGTPELRKGSDVLVEGARRAGFEVVLAGGQLEGARSLGVLDPDTLAWAYAAADRLLFPTRYEGCSYVLLEALACGLPVHSGLTGWMPELLERIPAYRELLVEPTVDSIERSLRGVSDERAAQLADEARAFVHAELGLATFAQRWQRVARSVVSA